MICFLYRLPFAVRNQMPAYFNTLQITNSKIIIFNINYNHTACSLISTEGNRVIIAFPANGVVFSNGVGYLLWFNQALGVRSQKRSFYFPFNDWLLFCTIMRQQVGRPAKPPQCSSIECFYIFKGSVV